MKRFIIFSVLLMQFHFGFSQKSKGVSVGSISVQNEKKGKTYALIIGISKYEDPKMPQLEYADSDAVNFYRYLRSKTGGNVDSMNIRLLIDKYANSTDIWREFNWIMRRADSFDRVYIYFSGHGDGGDNQEEVYLLTHETAKVDDPGLYVPTSALPIMNLKTKIKTLVSKNVEVILITDACRTNELPGKNKTNELVYRHVMDEDLGAIQIASCKANQMSQEGKRWGNGRGVFSFYLINGLYGLADVSPTDGQVDLEELETYVKENVKHDTKSLSSGIPLQVPAFTGRNTTLCTVDITEKKNIEKASVYYERETNLAFKRGIFIYATDSIVFYKFIQAINEERLLAPEKNNAVYWLDILLEKTKDENARADITDLLVASLMKKGQQPINYYSKGLDEFNYQYFKDASSYFSTALKYVKNNPETYKLVNASRLFLEARALRESKNDQDWTKALGLADSSLNLFQWSYTYHTKGLLFANLKMYDSSLFYERKVIDLAPGWFFSLGYTFCELKQYDSALYYFRVCIKANPNDEAAYNNLGYVFHNLKQKDSAVYYYRIALKLNPKFDVAYNNLGNTFYKLKQYDSSIYYYKIAININPKFELPYYNLGNSFYYLKQKDSAMYYYKIATKLNLKDEDVYNNVALIYFNLKQYDSAVYYYKTVLKLNQKSGKTYFDLGLTYCNLKQNDSAMYYLKIGLKLDPKNEKACNNLGSLYSNLKQYDSCVYYYKLSLNLNPVNETACIDLGYAYINLRQYNSAIYYYKMAINLNPKNEWAYNNLGLIFGNLKQYDSAVYYYKICIMQDPKNEWAAVYLGSTYYNLKQNDFALLYNKIAIKLNPKNEYGYFYSGLTYYNLKQYDSALYYLKISIKLNPKNGLAYYYSGNIYYNLKQNDSTIYFYKKSIEINPESGEYYYALARVYSLKEEKNSALKYFDSALQKGYRDFVHIVEDTDLDFIRSFNEYGNLIKKYFPDKMKK